jgi:hypothetical protein
MGTDDNEAIQHQHVEFVIPEWAAKQLGDALISGSVGVMREFDI